MTFSAEHAQRYFCSLAHNRAHTTGHGPLLSPYSTRSLKENFSLPIFSRFVGPPPPPSDCVGYEYHSPTTPLQHSSLIPSITHQSLRVPRSERKVERHARSQHNRCALSPDPLTISRVNPPPHSKRWNDDRCSKEEKEDTYEARIDK